MGVLHHLKKVHTKKLVMLTSFDPTKKEHVEWLKSVVDASNTDKLKVMIDNPMKKRFEHLEMVQVLFALSMKYTQAVFKKTAYILD